MILKRVKELETLENDFLKPTSTFVCIFGRKHVGKTTLLYEYTKTKSVLFFSCIEILPKLLFQSFVQQLNGTQKIISGAVESFDEFLTCLSQLHFEKKTVLIFDDFHTLQRLQKESLQLFFKHWNKQLKYKNIQIILSSSLHSSLKDDKDIYQSASENIVLKSFEYDVIKEILPNISNHDQLRVFALFGTNIQYIKKYNPLKEFKDNIKEIFLEHKSQIKEDGLMRIKNELSETTTYSSILYAVAKGHHKIGEIAEVLNVKSSYLTRYMQKLIDMMILQKVTPINENGAYSKFGRYVFEDNYMKFWFAFIYQNSALFSEDFLKVWLKNCEREFEEVFVYEAFKTSMFDLIYNNFELFFQYKPIGIGSYWNNKDKQIDLIGYDSSTITFIELRYKASQDVKQIYEELKIKSQLFETVLNKKFVIFSSY